MIAPVCKHTESTKNGKSKAGLQRFKCKSCGVGFTEENFHDGPLGKMRVDVDKAMIVISMLLEGMSIRACERITGMNRDTIDRLILEVGDKCQNFHDYNVQNVACSDLQLDEIWSFVGMKARKAKNQDDATQGDSWTYIALDRETKLIAAHHVGGRTGEETNIFLAKLRRAIDTSQRFQVSTDGWGAYKYGVPFNLGGNVDFGQLVKKYASQQTTTRYSPAVIISAEKRPRFGNPDHDRICTSHVESLNQKIRMHLRRFTRLTNAHSKSLKHHEAMQAIFFAWYNFCRLHLALGKQTPAMAAGIVNRKLELVDLLG